MPKNKIAIYMPMAWGGGGVQGLRDHLPQFLMLQTKREIGEVKWFFLRLTVVEMVESWTWYPGGNNLLLSWPIVAKGKVLVLCQRLRLSRGVRAES